MSLHNSTNGSSEGLDLFADWARTAPDKFDETDVAKKWESFRSERDQLITLGTLYQLAKDGGWSGPQKASPTSEIEWPKMSKSGRPISKSQENIEAALKHLKVELYYDEFSLGWFYSRAEQNHIALDDRGPRELHMVVNRAGLQLLVRLQLGLEKFALASILQSVG